MKRFLVFSMCHYYPSGGWGDFRKDCDTLEEARKVASGSDLDYYQIVDTDIMDEVEFGSPKELKKELELYYETHVETDELKDIGV